MDFSVLDRDLLVNSNVILPCSSKSISPVSSNSISNKAACSFERSVSRDLSPTSIRDGYCSTSSIQNQSQSKQFKDKSHQNGENAESFVANDATKSSTTNLSTSTSNFCNKYHESLDNSMPLSNLEKSSNSFYSNGSVEIDKANINDIIHEETQLLQGDSDLRQFDVLDELEGSDQEEGQIVESNSGESELELDGELSLDDIDEMLEGGLPEEMKISKNRECPVKLRRKVVLEEIGHDHFDLLPEGWIKIIHCCGMPVYLHKKSRVCTMAKPYYLGPGSSRNHRIPLSAIPCLHYKRASELEKKDEEEKEQNKLKQNHQSQPEIELISDDVEFIEENKETQSLDASELHEYCKIAFKFKTLTLIPFKTWENRKKYNKMRKESQKNQRLTLPGETTLLKFPIKNADGSFSKWIINPNGKSYVCILHEYVQQALKKQPTYQFQELENPATPYSATVFIEGMNYGFGMGASKKHAKSEAAKAALEVLLPGMKGKTEPDNQFGVFSGTTKKSREDTDLSIFDQIEVEDPRVTEFCLKSTEPPPYAILLTCVGRNTGVGQVEISYHMNSNSNKQDEFTMSVGNHKATIACRNKREGKQRAAQAILKALHPNITYWGSLLRMYGNRSIKNIKEKKQIEQEITKLQSKASFNQPNYALLNKLKTELLKLKDKQSTVQAKGTFYLPNNIVLPSLSSTDLNKINLSSQK